MAEENHIRSIDEADKGKYGFLGDKIDLVEFLQQDKKEREERIEKEGSHKIAINTRELYTESKGRLAQAKKNEPTDPGIMLRNPKEVHQTAAHNRLKKFELQQQLIDSLTPEK